MTLRIILVRRRAVQKVISSSTPRPTSVSSVPSALISTTSPSSAALRVILVFSVPLDLAEQLKISVIASALISTPSPWSAALPIILNLSLVPADHHPVNTLHRSAALPIILNLSLVPADHHPV